MGKVYETRKGHVEKRQKFQISYTTSDEFISFLFILFSYTTSDEFICELFIYLEGVYFPILQVMSLFSYSTSDEFSLLYYLFRRSLFSRSSIFHEI